MSAATISASGVLRATNPWRLEMVVRGKQVFGAWTRKYTPDVLFVVAMHPAKSASENKRRVKASV